MRSRAHIGNVVDDHRQSVGGIFLSHATRALTNCVLLFNTAGRGGAIYNDSGSLTAHGTTFADAGPNGTAVALGGAIANVTGTPCSWRALCTRVLPRGVTDLLNANNLPVDSLGKKIRRGGGFPQPISL